ncbi:hypothetical protein ASPSYDRAFT_50689 [Aspergillus sydowii CBS 593.65]|uniref:Arrestin-like N-terminal domain-containing protein n=1 Tax=Aspergillus sydowii CBS 593.65 TaxID=1036612 RepID=A0A1L9T3C5_9EURO|nr:uncharacterized protein ASPSYDRAFT_50689 [Aspergillus sydowii CBS 593.65]OJJ53918.1 hypothetical protein ASPSYDRAFT_50689 [Aspergillus sydowii CBS 593.65]
MKRTISCSNTLSVDIRVKKPPNANVIQNYVSSFATGEKIEGVVSIVSQNDLSFDNLYISFIGEESADIPSSIPDKAHRQFLRLEQSIDESAIPSPKVFKNGRRYEIPFNFEVTDYLPASSCRHSANPLVKAAHLHPPPSCGDASIAGFGGKLRDDFAPSGCHVNYYIHFKLDRPSITTGLQETIMAKRLKVRIKPAVGDVPLPDIPLGSLADEYSLHHEEPIHSNFPKRLIGHLAMTLEQPECFYHPLRDPIRLISKAIRIFLVYQPSKPADSKPPELKYLRAQIIATTIYTTNINDTHPPSKKKDFLGRPINFRDAELPLSIPSLPRLRWTLDGTGGYTATLLVPVTLPKDKSFIPTFHSCLISRVYSLAFQLSAQGTSSPFRLRAAMQIAAERDPSALPSYNASLGVIDTA